jgi:beta-galactosidase
MVYGADYYPEHWPQERWPEDARLMEEAGFNVVRMAEFAWTHMEPREGACDFAWLDRAIALLADHGIQTVLGTPTAAPPAWLMRAYPECFLVNEHGQRLTYGHRRNNCPTQPIYREYSARIVRAMAEHFASNPNVIGWQIDNEFGDRCYCPVCQRAFQEWLKAKYGSLEALNAAWGTEFWSHIYTAWQEIPVPLATSYTNNPGLALDYRRFMSDTYVQYQRMQVEILRQHAPGQFITHNFMGFGYPKLNYFDLAADLDFVAWDNYPRYRGQPDLPWLALAHDTMRGLKGANFWVMEAQSGPAGQLETGTMPRPGEIPFWAWQAIAHGADGIVFFRWRSCRFGAEEYWHGILDHDGTPRRRYREVAEMGALLKRVGDYITGSRPVVRAALLLSYDSRFALQNQPVNPALSYERVFAQYYRALWARNVGVDVVPPGADLSRYALVVAPLLYILDAPTAQQVREYVERGGTLITTCRSGVMDEHNMVVNQPLPGLFAEVCGVEVDEYDSLDADVGLSLAAEAALGGGTYGAHVWADVLEPHGAEVLARYASEYYAGRGAVTEHRFGQGRAIYVGTIADQNLLDRLIGYVCAGLRLAPPLQAPAGVEVTVREKDGASLVFVLNGTAEEKAVEVAGTWRDLLTGQVVSGAVQLPPLGVMILHQT